MPATVAVKIVDRTRISQDDDEALRQEVGILKQLDHPNVVRLLDFFEEPKQYLVILELLGEHNYLSPMLAHNLINTILRCRGRRAI